MTEKRPEMDAPAPCLEMLAASEREISLEEDTPGSRGGRKDPSRESNRPSKAWARYVSERPSIVHVVEHIQRLSAESQRVLVAGIVGAAMHSAMAAMAAVMTAAWTTTGASESAHLPSPGSAHKGFDSRSNAEGAAQAEVHRDAGRAIP